MPIWSEILKEIVQSQEVTPIRRHLRFRYSPSKVPLLAFMNTPSVASSYTAREALYRGGRSRCLVSKVALLSYSRDCASAGYVSSHNDRVCHQRDSTRQAFISRSNRLANTAFHAGGNAIHACSSGFGSICTCKVAMKLQEIRIL